MIGVFGGTFDPVHYGHIKPALSVQQALNLTQIRFVPNRIPPHRDVPWLNSEQRLSLLKCALQNIPDVCIDERELHREGPSYMVETLQSLKQDMPDEALCLIIGMDAFYGITDWFKWKSLFDLCHLIVTTRPGFDQASISDHMSSEDYAYLRQRMTQDVNALSPLETGKILLQSVPQLDVSSTQIRTKLLNNEEVSQWLPGDVIQQLKRFTLDDNR